MTNEEMAERSRKAIEAFNKLPPEEQVRRMIAYGTIDEHGRVRMGEENGKVMQKPKPGQKTS